MNDERFGQAQRVLEDFWGFWTTYFPEISRFNQRQQVLAELRDAEFGMPCTLPDRDPRCIQYQENVARIYGAYESAHYQELTLREIMTLVDFTRVEAGHLVSLGCGPASYELLLLKHGCIGRATLVDESSEMLKRAREIAEKIGVADRITTICADAAESGLPSESTDYFFSINAMHWSQRWREWIAEGGRILKNGERAFVTCSLYVPGANQWKRTRINRDELVAAFQRHFVLSNEGFVVPATTVPGTGMMSFSSRYLVTGVKQATLSKAAQKRQRKAGRR